MNRTLFACAVASWLVRSSSDRAVRVRALAGDIVLGGVEILLVALCFRSRGKLGSDIMYSTVLVLISRHCCFISFPLFAVGISLPFFVQYPF